MMIIPNVENRRYICVPYIHDAISNPDPILPWTLQWISWDKLCVIRRSWLSLCKPICIISKYCNKQPTKLDVNAADDPNPVLAIITWPCSSMIGMMMIEDNNDDDDDDDDNGHDDDGHDDDGDDNGWWWCWWWL